MRTLAIGPVTRSSNAPGSECKRPEFQQLGLPALELGLCLAHSGAQQPDRHHKMFSVRVSSFPEMLAIFVTSRCFGHSSYTRYSLLRVCFLRQIGGSGLD